MLIAHCRSSARPAAAKATEREIERGRNTLTNMPTETPNPTVPEVLPSPSSKDLRAELQSDLKLEFAANLSAAGTLPKAVCESLVELLDASGPISANVIALLALEDPIQPEVPHE
jgi:hypothetical protein